VSYDGNNKAQINDFYDSFQWAYSNETFEFAVRNVTNALDTFYYFYDGQYLQLSLYNNTQLQVLYNRFGVGDNDEPRKASLVPVATECIIPPELGGENDLSVGTILIIVFLCATFCYCGTGILYNSIHKKTGLERIPNYGFWMATYTYTLAGFSFTYTLMRRYICRQKDTSPINNKFVYEQI